MFILIFLVILTVLVLIHEAGHYFVAKWFGIKVEEFGFGFPPRAWGKKIGETIYSINWLPIGGFVKLYGEDDAGGGKINLPVSRSKYQVSGIEDKEQIHNTKYMLHDTDLKRTFFARPVYQRALVVLAGVIMNTLLAGIIYYTYLGISNFKAELPHLGNHKFVLTQQTTRLDGLLVIAVQKESPAALVGIKDCRDGKYCANITAVNRQKITSSQFFLDTIKANRGKPVTLTYQDVLSKKSQTVSLIPRANPPKGQGSLGIEFGIYETTVLNYKTPVQKLLSGFSHPYNLMAYQYDILGGMIRSAFKSHNFSTLGTAVSGPVGIAKVVQQIGQIPAWKERMLQYLNLAGLLSISLAFFNVLPIPALDGGRLFFILIEGIFRRKVSPKIEGYIHTVGMIILLGLILLITFKDIFFKVS